MSTAVQKVGRGNLVARGRVAWAPAVSMGLVCALWHAAGRPSPQFGQLQLMSEAKCTRISLTCSANAIQPPLSCKVPNTLASSKDKLKNSTHSLNPTAAPLSRVPQTSTPPKPMCQYLTVFLSWPCPLHLQNSHVGFSQASYIPSN